MRNFGKFPKRGRQKKAPISVGAKMHLAQFLASLPTKTHTKPEPERSEEARVENKLVDISSTPSATPPSAPTCGWGARGK